MKHRARPNFIEVTSQALLEIYSLWIVMWSISCREAFETHGSPAICGHWEISLT